MDGSKTFYSVYLYVLLLFRSTANKVEGGLFPAFVDEATKTGISKTFEIYYKHEDVVVNDVFVFKFHMLLDSARVSLS